MPQTSDTASADGLPSLADVFTPPTNNLPLSTDTLPPLINNLPPRENQPNNPSGSTEPAAPTHQTINDWSQHMEEHDQQNAARSPQLQQNFQRQQAFLQNAIDNEAFNFNTNVGTSR